MSKKAATIKKEEVQFNKKTVRAVIACVVVLALLLVFINTAIFYRNVNAVTITGPNGGQDKFSIVDFNFYYTTMAHNAYNEIYSTYGDLTSYIFDLTVPYEDQMYDDTYTWDDYLSQRAIFTMKNIIFMNTLAENTTEFELTAEQEEELEAHFDSVKATAADANISLSRYYQSVYGKGMNDKIYRENYTELFTAQCFSEYMSEKIENDYTEEQVAAYYEAYPGEFNAVAYRVYTINAATGDDVDAEQALEDAKAAADKIAAEISSIETFEAAVAAYEEENEITSGLGGGHALLADVEGTTYGEWLFDDERVSGDVTVVENNAEDATGYYVVYFDKLDTLDYNFADIYTNIFYAGQDEETGEVTEEAKAEALKAAEAFLEEWKSGDANEDSFAEIATELAEEDSNIIPGHVAELYNGVTGVAAIENWALDEARQEGDAEIIELTTGYVVVYYVGEGANARDSIVRGVMASEDYSAWVDEYTAQYTELIHIFGYYFTRDF